MTILKVGLYKYKRVVGVIIILISAYHSYCQKIDPDINPNDTIYLENPEYESIFGDDAIRTLPFDSTFVSDSSVLVPDTSVLVSDTSSLASDTIPQGEIETTIHYFARDSMRLDLNTHEISIFGEGRIDYGQIELTADRVNINYDTHEIMAVGTEDSLGNTIGDPVFKDGPENYETKNMRYNFKSKKAIISGVVTQQGEGIMHGNLVKRNPEGDLFIDHAKYTTCNLPNPHFHIEANKLKLIPNNKILVGPFHMRVADIPLPIGWAFGMFPMPRQKASGIRFPTFGEEERRGFYLRDGGYYFAISDYIDLLLLGEIYTKGSYGLKLASTYKKRYSYTGSFSFKYNRQRGIDEGDSSVIKDFWVTWNHTPQSKGNSRFSASVRAGTSSYNQNNPSYYDVTNNINQEFSSNVIYSKTFTGTPFSMGASMRIQQNTRTSITNIQLPDLSFSMNRVYPFKGKSPSARNIFQKINLSWNMTGTNRLTNAPLRTSTSFDVANEPPLNDSTVAFTASNWDIISARAQNGVRHSIPVSTSTKIFKHFTLNPSIRYDEIWYGQQLDYTWIDSLNAVRIDTLKKFSRLYSYSFSAGMTSRLYGTLFFKGDNIQAIRHVMTPNVSFSYSPDFSDEKFGYYQDVQIDSLGNTREISRYNGFVYGTPSQGEVASIGFSLDNNLEMKVRSKKDSADREFKKVPIFENFSLSSGYNFLADSFNLAPIRLSARTKLFNKKVDINMNATLDPYIYVLDTFYVDEQGNERISQRKVSRYAWDEGQGLGHITNATLSIGTSLNPEAWENKASDLDRENLSESERTELDYIEQNPDLYVDFSIPWNVRVNYNISYSKAGYQKSNITQTLRLTGDFSLTPKWKVGYQTGYDFESKEITQTNLNINRDLHCWQLSLTWVPFGRYQSYNVTIRAKSSLLQDLKLNKQRSWWDN
ncbi:MAG: LPS-assembly protein LptD [Cyclobacteriaceae bacterium]|nr:LPS-assembly protein LptD [Cyclobacteriaceae bacterium]